MSPKNITNNIFRKVLWFDKKETFDLRDLYEFLTPQRTVSDKPRYISGLFHSDKCGRDIYPGLWTLLTSDPTVRREQFA